MFRVAPGNTERIHCLSGPPASGPTWAIPCLPDYGASRSRSTWSGTRTPANGAEPRSSLSQSPR